MPTQLLHRINEHHDACYSVVVHTQRPFIVSYYRIPSFFRYPKPLR
jgi:hypothetical protein